MYYQIIPEEKRCANHSKHAWTRKIRRRSWRWHEQIEWVQNTCEIENNFERRISIPKPIYLHHINEFKYYIFHRIQLSDEYKWFDEFIPKFYLFWNCCDVPHVHCTRSYYTGDFKIVKIIWRDGHWISLQEDASHADNKMFWNRLNSFERCPQYSALDFLRFLVLPSFFLPPTTTKTSEETMFKILKESFSWDSEPKFWERKSLKERWSERRKKPQISCDA